MTNAAKSSGARSNRLKLLGAAAAAAVLLVGTLVAVSLGGGDGSKSEGAAAGQLTGVREARQLFAGIPQDGFTLGNPKAPVTMVEYADPQCPFCADFSRTGLPTVVERYVRPGKVRLELGVLRFLGEDSAEAAAAVAAAAQQKRAWQYMDLFLANQGEENSGYVTDDFLRELGAALPGLDVERMMADARSSEAEELLAHSESEANKAGVQGTPAFRMGPSGGSLVSFEPQSFEPGALASALDEALQSSR